jgi:hypothetical protein
MSRDWPPPDKDDGWAWSCYGGAWRKVVVDYPLGFNLPSRPESSMVLGLFVTVATGALTAGLLFILVNLTLNELFGASHNWASFLVFGGGAVAVILLLGWVLVTGLKVAVDSIRDLGQRTTVQGMVFHFPQAGEWITPRTAVRTVGFGRGPFVAIDEDGVAEKVKALYWLPFELERGDIVRAVIAPRRRYVYQLDIIAIPQYRQPTVVTWGAETMGVAVATEPAPWVVPEVAVPEFYAVDATFVQYVTGLPVAWVDREEHRLRSIKVRRMDVRITDTYRDAAGNSFQISVLYNRNLVKTERARLQRHRDTLPVDGLGATAYWKPDGNRLTVFQDGRRLYVDCPNNVPPRRAFATSMTIARRMLTGQ